jgi:predicted dehydrogenase
MKSMRASKAPCVRWGILGAGHIASKLARDLVLVPGVVLQAVASRSREKAAGFCEDLDIPRRYDKYSDIAADPDVDVVYIATPHAFHRDHSILCMDAGKAVLCEKPFALNRHQARDMVDAARRNGVFLMEALWTRFLPVIRRVHDTVASGTLGSVKLLCADFGFIGGGYPDGRLFRPDLGGGALLDVGIYPITLAFLLLGHPDDVRSLCRIGSTGVDEQCAMVFGYPERALAVLSASVVAKTAQEAMVFGTEGTIRMHAPWWRTTLVTVAWNNGETEDIRLPMPGNGFTYEIEEVMDCLRKGETESETMPLAETLAVMGVMDRMRESWGMKYPGE